MKKSIKAFVISMLLVFSSFSFAQNENDIMSYEERQDYLRDKISKLDSGYSNAKILPTSNPDFYLVVSNEGQKIYITKDGETLIFGSVFKNVDDSYLVDLENELLSSHRKDVISKLDNSKLIKYPATSEYKSDLYVFSDMSCPYCQKMHKDLDEIRNAGFDVYYIPYPRMGMTRNVYAVKGLKKIMCSENPAVSFDNAFADPEKYARNITDNEMNCKSAELLEDFYKLGSIMGVEGTPATFLPDGSYISGFSSLSSFTRDLVRNYEMMLRKKGDE